MAQDTRTVRINTADESLMQRVQADIFSDIMQKKVKAARMPTQADALNAALKAYFELKRLKKQAAAG